LKPGAQIRVPGFFLSEKGRDAIRNNRKWKKMLSPVG
jgi:hypothetical protein